MAGAEGVTAGAPSLQASGPSDCSKPGACAAPGFVSHSRPAESAPNTPFSAPKYRRSHSGNPSPFSRTPVWLYSDLLLRHTGQPINLKTNSATTAEPIKVPAKTRKLTRIPRQPILLNFSQSLPNAMPE